MTAAILLLPALVLTMTDGAGAPHAAIAGEETPRVGDILAGSGFHLVTNPGLYGLGPARIGNRYAVVSGMLVRIDEKTLKILSILRGIDAILD
ncbi:hypothetical protein [Paracoccus salsus]|uniref:hypothetical protein n=1 Tax=Paracoccus salsus TaxID=2911061 RepID=UPI001F230445|nr:hypothetical protein [Paracoccus salsus]MCF3973483.1 hypothetical protein [Paracoccus salsus]